MRRVGSEEEADFYWFVRATSFHPDGELMYAAYLWDICTKPERVVAEDTLADARARLAEHLSTSSLRGVITKILS